MGLLEDARNIQRKDPAARNVLEVILLYPGFHILVYHRIAHWLYRHKRFFLARWVSQHGRRRTGIEIHPGATIGRCLFIDHGMGIVFGETCEIGDNCTIYHGVTLGGTGKDTGKRHPTLGNNVLIGAGTKVLGPVYIGDNSRIGAGSVVLRNLPANCTAVGVPAEVVRINNKAVNPADDLDQQDLPDIVATDRRTTEVVTIQNALRSRSGHYSRNLYFLDASRKILRDFPTCLFTGAGTMKKWPVSRLCGCFRRKQAQTDQVSLLDPFRENATADSPQAVRCCSIIRYFSAEGAQSASGGHFQ